MPNAGQGHEGPSGPEPHHSLKELVNLKITSKVEERWRAKGAQPTDSPAQLVGAWALCKAISTNSTRYLNDIRRDFHRRVKLEWTPSTFVTCA